MFLVMTGSAFFAALVFVVFEAIAVAMIRRAMEGIVVQEIVS